MSSSLSVAASFAVNGRDVGLDLLQAPGHHGGVKATLLAPAVEIGGVKARGSWTLNQAMRKAIIT